VHARQLPTANTINIEFCAVKFRRREDQLRVVVTKLIVATIVAAPAVGVIAGSRSSNPNPSQVVRAGRLDEFGQLDALMNCADASYACPGGLFIAPPQPAASYTIKVRSGDFERSLIVDPLGMLIALEEYGQTRRVDNMVD
jgi:hypothetical protein